MIKHISFKHGWFYHYRVHSPKTDSLCVNSLAPIKDYLYDMFENCPNDYFQKGPRGSALKFKLDVDIREIQGHEVSGLASKGLEMARFNTAHTNVQMFMLQNDDKTVSIEVPLFMMPGELAGYEEIFGSREPLTGHIDALRIEEKLVWIWDYKPNAHREKYAMTQTNFYAIMLSRRTGIPLDQFRCGYFDDERAYVFKPIAQGILKSKLI